MRTKPPSLQVAVLALYLVTCLAYGIVNPPFESPDEIYHYDYVEALLRDHRLPVAQNTISEYHQSPLYYLVGAGLTAWLAPGQPAPQLMRSNPFWAWRIGAVGVDNKSQYQHGPEQGFPYTGTWLRLHLLRVLSAVLGAIALWQIAGFARLLAPGQEELAILALAFVAFLPQFLYVSSSVSNDIALATCSALAATAVGRFLIGSPRRLRDASLAGLWVGCAILVKMSALALWALVALCIGGYLLFHRRGDRRQLLAGLAAVGLLPLLLAGPLFVRNIRIYGEATALSRMDAIWGRQDPPLSWGLALTRELPNIWTSFWGRFAYGQIPIPNVIYGACLAATLLALAGALYSTARSVAPSSVPAARRGYWNKERTWLLGFAGALIGAFGFAVLRYSRISFNGSAGRFVFPALPAIAYLLATGWLQAADWLCAPRRIAAGALSAAMFGFSVWALLFIIRPAYVLPASASSADATQGGVRLGDVAVLRRIALADPVLKPGTDALVEVEWQPLRQTIIPLAFFVHLIGPGGELLGARDSYPGMGRTATSYWQPGTVFKDTYRVPVALGAARAIAPAGVRVEAGLYDPATGERLPALDQASGASLAPPFLAEAKLPPAPPEAGGADRPDLATIGDSLRLDRLSMPARAEAGVNQVPIRLGWTVLRPLPCDCKLFIHLVRQPGDQPLAQLDEPVLAGRYPGRLWAPGEWLDDEHWLALPAGLAPGRYRLMMGLYDAASGQRFPVHSAGDTQQTSDSFELGLLDVAR